MMMGGIFNLQIKIAAARREFPATATLPTNFNLRITGSHAIISKAFWNVWENEDRGTVVQHYSFGSNASSAGPWCTRLLKDLGAKVIKVEPPGGDVTRTFGHRIRDPTSKTTSSTYFATVNNGKECICLDLKHVTDRKVFEQLMLRSDVFLLKTIVPGVMERLDLRGNGFTKRTRSWYIVEYPDMDKADLYQILGHLIQSYKQVLEFWQPSRPSWRWFGR